MTTTTQARSQELAVALRRLAVASATVTDASDQQADVLALILNRNEAAAPQPYGALANAPGATNFEKIVNVLLSNPGTTKAQAVDDAIRRCPNAHKEWIENGGGKL